MADTFAADKVTDQEEKEQLMQLVGFTIGNEQFGVDILMVQEIIRSAPITSVPNSPDFIEGVINLRGNIIPVIELRKRLNLFREETASKDAWILILDINSRVTGFIVDSVTRVLKIMENTIEPPPEVVVAGLANQYIRGVCDIGEGLLIMLDFNSILLADELKQLKSIEGA
ncbi:MAG: purine-binding chemotaxis protein CheW [Candidatus Electrothrix sp. AW2]|jgi:purine-binding chemotaxis protein CheW|nr:purine-binding chemotaxis protein CheW [Candidatus Electrothrix sp. AX1]MCI5118767.1 purine-binding chemotaxis protein CheW [Candidatus Electrothrix gigas]MCI5128093.1 purine-binding chemotaxis protein CheW [Candidatus Electrothrix gigas]MCI5133807.1 purine-binding chemotaxis protein CheW [Candidatus Electrothrix gigas]MCI5178025.1 purine-binding chemotaxis protein CheW [Candidatus Electrothrix gigas]